MTPAQQGSVSASRAPETSNAFLLTRAYRCFGFLGLVTLPFGLAGLLEVFGLMNFGMGTVGKNPTGVGEVLTRWAFVAGIFLGLPIAAGVLCATIYGILQAARFRHPPLVALSVISILCGGGLLTVMANEWDTNPVSPAITYAMGIAGALYMVANSLIPLWWFTKGRQRQKTRAPVAVQ